MSQLAPAVWCGEYVATGLSDYADDFAALRSGGKWVVVSEFEGAHHLLKFDTWTKGDPGALVGAWSGPADQTYVSSLDESAYRAAVHSVRSEIERGWIYQANICRTLSAPLLDPQRADVLGLASLLRAQNPAPYAIAVRAPEVGIEIASASPELFVSRDDRTITSGPIKGTAATESGITAKDRAENVMITDLVRNDLSRICQPGTVRVENLLSVEHHPTVVHLVSRIAGELETAAEWPQIFDAMFPPGSVSGAPKYSALRTIRNLEPTPRGPYCGAIGWVDVDRRKASLAVGIRTFWKTRFDRHAFLNFGTGAGITWGSDPTREWEETQLKARHLISIASGSTPGGGEE